MSIELAGAQKANSLRWLFCSAALYPLNPQIYLTFTPARSPRRDPIRRWEIPILDQPVDHGFTQSDASLDLVQSNELIRLLNRHDFSPPEFGVPPL